LQGVRLHRHRAVPRRKTRDRRRCCGVAVCASAISIISLLGVTGPAPHAAADELGYLVNVTVLPGNGFTDAGDALQQGYAVCTRVSDGHPYGDVLADVEERLQADDAYHAAYVINQAINELCPAQTWQLRQSAVGYRSPSGG
jgi:uncharacterized protein DUF732